MRPSTATRRYVAFDIETAKDVPGDFAQWRNHRPLGIICAATCESGTEPRLWHSKTPDLKPAPQMTQADLRELVGYLSKVASEGHTILTWNGASFDFDILAEESGQRDECVKCTHEHVDMMFHIVCLLGYPIGLEKVAKGMGLPGKAGGMSGSQAPKLWMAGEHAKVLDYVAQDVRLALQVAAECEKRLEFSWITQRGTPKTEKLSGGWKTVREALQLPLPDTSWMTTPKPREEFLAWMRSAK